MKTLKLNTHAETFAGRYNGSVEQYRGLHIVTYKYGSSPSLAYWDGRQKHPVKNIHFLYPTVRAFYIEKLKAEHDGYMRFRMIRKIQRKLQPAVVSMT